MLGKTIGHYKVTDRLGAGGMGVVWLAEDIRLGRKVALKMLREELTSSPEKRQRFEREARSVAALNHPNIVTLHSVEEADGVRFLTMEYVEGRTLAQRIVPGGLLPSDLLRIAAQVADALDAAHAAGIVHRDLKPGNILLAKDGRVKVVDFGLARAVGGESGPFGALRRETSLTQEGLAIGTLNYMSPEQLSNKSVDHRADLFALGVVMFEMATGEMPFPGDSAAQLISSVMRDRARRIDEQHTKLPPQIVDLVDALLAKNPSERPASAAEVRDRLNAAIKLLDSETSNVSYGELASRGIGRSVGDTTRPQSRFPVDATPLRSGRGQPLARRVALGAIALAVVAAVVVAWRLQRAPASPPAGSAPTKTQALAVLPLRSFSGDPDYFVDGTTDALISALAKIHGLRVISRQSVMRFRTSDRPLPEIARELGADLLIEGSVSRTADRIRLQLKLLRADPEETIWADSLERATSEAISLNAEAAAAIAREAGVVTTSNERGLVPMNDLDPDLYDRLLRAQYASIQLTPESLERSVALYREILASEPGSAIAWAGLAIDYGLLGFFSLPPLEASGRAEEAARKALELDERLSDAHAALGFVQHFYRWDWPMAEASYRRALELNPNDASTHHRLWALLVLLGRWEDAGRELETARRLDPLSVSISTNVGQDLGLRGDFEGAIRALERALRLQPGYGVAESHLWAIYHELGRDPERGVALVRALRGLGFEESAKAAEAALARTGYAQALSAAAGALAAESARTGTVSYIVAELYVAAGEHDEGLAWLRRGYLDRGPEMSWIAVARAFVPLRSRPEYQELLRGLRLQPQDGRQAATRDR
jgi:serine/threonine protein kinase/TolB-like protein/Flp pilus assembly protein TadD